MQRIEVGRYEHPETHGYAGWMAPKSRKGQIPDWVLFIENNGTVCLGVKDETGELMFATPDPGADNLPPRTFTRDADDPTP